ncbi:MAG: STAS domain-containing protein [Aetokthonos hydrillicola CCALA 1050]|nr:STAS domain-containing protein [Aetokthonos hydrillicola CCALA 1050]MBW4590275.1 STAS domain-containing protein [Aetokthonos hydrillicola CCALA 1050]
MSPIKIIELSGFFNANKGDELTVEIKDIADTKKIEILLLDMKNVNFIDSSGLGALAKVKKIINQTNTKLFLCSLNDQVRILFEMTHMDSIIKILKDREEFEQEILVHHGVNKPTISNS